MYHCKEDKLFILSACMNIFLFILNLRGIIEAWYLYRWNWNTFFFYFFSAVTRYILLSCFQQVELALILIKRWFLKRLTTQTSRFILAWLPFEIGLSATYVQSAYSGDTKVISPAVLLVFSVKAREKRSIDKSPNERLNNKYSAILDLDFSYQ